MGFVTSLYAAALATLYFLLSVNVIRRRRDQHIGFGHGNDRKLERAIRAHANFAEYVPIILLLMLLSELRHATAFWLNIFGGALLLGRLIHAYGFNQEPELSGARTVGLSLTFTSLLGRSILNLARFLSA